MPIVKQQASQPLVRDAVVLDLGDLGRQAAHLRSAAEARAQQILADARAEAARIIAGAEEQGRTQGHAEGLAKGLEEGRAQGHAEALATSTTLIQQTTTKFSELAQQWDTDREQLEREARTAVLDFAVKFAQKLTHRVVEVEPGLIVDQVAAALSRVLEPTDVSIRVHPDDRDTLKQVLPDLLAGLSHLQHVDVLDDPEVGHGGCKLAIKGGEIDATIGTQMRRIVEVIMPGRDVELEEDQKHNDSPRPSSTQDNPEESSNLSDAGEDDSPAASTPPEG